jgi:hypothetical protein
MAGPWERYAAPPAADAPPSGPWSRYAQPAAAEPAPEETGRGGGFFPFVNRNIIAGTLGAPVDIINAGLGAVGLPVSDQPFGGSASIEAGLARFGQAVGVPMVPAPGQRPETAAEYVGAGVGGAAGMLIPGYGAARLAAQSAAPLTARVGQSLTQGMTRAPITTTAAELTAGATAGAGRMIAETNFPGNEAAGVLGELAGGLTPSAVAGATGMLMQMPLAQRAASAFVPFTPAGARERAANRLRSLAEDPDAASRAAGETPIGELTPAQRTGEARLMALERTAARDNPQLDRQLRAQASRAQATLEAEARALGGDPTRTRAFLETRVTRLTNALDLNVQQAQARARERIAALEPGTAAAESSRIVREEFDEAFQAARAQENVLWRSIPGDVRFDTAPLFERFARRVNETPITTREDIPAYAAQFLGRGQVPDDDEFTAFVRQSAPDLLPDRSAPARLGATATPAELYGMRSKLLEIERIARDAGRRNEARVAGEIADDVLDIMNSLPDTAGPYAVARDFSRRVNDTFRRGEAGRLAETRDGAPAVPSDLTLERTIGAGGPRAGVAARQLLEATGDSQPTRQAIEDYLTRSFYNRFTTSEDRVRQEAADTWLRNNAVVLNQFPEVRQRIQNAMTAQSQAGTAAARQTAVERGLRQRDDTRMARLIDQRQESAVARYLNAEPDAEAARVLGADDPVAVAGALRRSVDRDPSGEALAGLRGAFVDHLLTRARQATPDGPVLQGSVIVDVLNNPRQAAALRQVFSPVEMQRLRQITSELTNLERSRGARALSGAVMSDVPSRLLGWAAAVLGARLGAAAAAGSGGLAGGLQTAARTASMFERFAGWLTQDRAKALLMRSVTDPELYSALLSPLRTIRQQEIAVTRLQGWLASPAGRAVFGDDVNELEQEPAQPNAMAPAPANRNAMAP